MLTFVDLVERYLKQGIAQLHEAGEHLPGLSQRLLAELRDVPAERRTARFHCVTALAAPDGALLATADGVCEGVIALGPSGDGGFGYDPVFYLPQYGLTMAQLDAAEKNRISHRGRAAAAIAPQLHRALAGR